MGMLFKPNLTFAEGGGVTSLIVPFQLNKAGIGAGMALTGAASIGREMFAQHNRMKMGSLTYTGGPARMTHNVDSGAIEAIKAVTNDKSVQVDMFKKIVRTNDSVVGNLEEFGVDEEFMSAFYGMG